MADDILGFLGSRAQSVIGGQIPENTLSLVVEYFDERIDRIDFQIPPMSINESKTAHYASENILGRFEPIRMYSNSDATRITFDVSYYWLEDNFKYSINTWEGVKANIGKIRALLYPYNNGTLSTTAGTDVAQFTNMDPIAQNAGSLTPPPVCKLFFGDIYRGTPCLLTGYNISYNGPWNDAHLSAVARRIAAQQQSRWSDALKKTTDINIGNQSIDPVSRLVDLIPTNWGVKGYLTNALQTALRFDKLFPLETKVSLTFETNYQFGVHLTYQDIVKNTSLSPVTSTTDGISKAKIIIAANKGFGIGL